MIFDYVHEPDHQRDLVQQGDDEALPAASFIPRCLFRPGPVLRRALHALEPAGHQGQLAGTNQCMAAGLGVVVVLFLWRRCATIWNVLRSGGGPVPAPFYDPQTFSLAAVSTGTSMAMLTYIGFDAISTLSEEAHNPRRNILLATVLTCLITGILACGAQVYAAQLVWPEATAASRTSTRRSSMSRGQAGGPALLITVNLALLVAQIGSGAGAHLAAGRLLYGMGRDNAIPRRFFACPGSPDPHPAKQHPAGGRSGAGRRVAVELRPRLRDAQLRRPDRLHGRESSPPSSATSSAATGKLR